MLFLSPRNKDTKLSAFLILSSEVSYLIPIVHLFSSQKLLLLFLLVYTMTLSKENSGSLKFIPLSL
jgi:hypothetical protein